MMNQALLNPKSIVVIGASNDIGKPGGKVLKNLIDGKYRGDLLVVNPKERNVQGVKSYSICEDLPLIDLAFIAIASHQVEQVVQVLANEKACKAYIIFSSGFGEIGEEGKALERRIVDRIQKTGGTLIGPNCIGLITATYKGVFAGPIPHFNPLGCECVSASGATMVFILEQAIARGISFSNIFSVGNSSQIGIEEILEYWDETYQEGKSSPIKLLYMEEISNPEKFLKHARSLVLKGCRIAAIKAGSTDAGSRAVSSHTGSLAGSDMAVSALFRKAGIVRCYSRLELVYVAGIFMHKPLMGKNLAIITHAGGPGVMLTDILTKGGMKVPKLEGPKTGVLLSKLFHGSSVSNPIDFLATGTAEQLGIILDSIDQDFDEIDASIVVFGTTGMWNVNNVYEVLHHKMNTCKKPIFPILPSVIQAAEEVSHFQSQGRINFRDEVSFGYVLSRVYRTPKPAIIEDSITINKQKIRTIIEQESNGYISNQSCESLLKAVGIEVAEQLEIKDKSALEIGLNQIGFPLVMKVVGPLHKSESGGVKLNIQNLIQAELAYDELMQIEEAKAVLIQQMSKGIEVFIGAKKEGKFGHLILCGLGGIFIEVFKDISAGLGKLSRDECRHMIQRLKSYPIIQGTRGKEGLNEEMFIETLMKISALLEVAPEIEEMDINPLMGNMNQLTAVDCRIRIEK
ncbi:MAG: acetate--CoA ligase family protein [Bacteroidia bacterium]